MLLYKMSVFNSLERSGHMQLGIYFKIHTMAIGTWDWSLSPSFAGVCLIAGRLILRITLNRLLLKILG